VIETSPTICAGIVSYNPEIGRLDANLLSVSKQVSRVFVVDNGSDNINEIEELLSRYSCIDLLRNKANEGIAKALNQLVKAAELAGFNHILFLDQDSVSTDGMVNVLSQFVGERIGIVAPQIIDRNKESIDDIDSALDHKTYFVETAARKGVITSGSLTNIQVCKQIGGFDENMFIDYVDYDLNKRLLLEGYKIIRTGDTALIHECGKAVPTWLKTPRKGQDGKWRLERFYSFGHSPFRCYYKARNRVIYSRKYKDCDQSRSFEGTLQIAPQIALTLLFEQDRKAKLGAFIRGIHDGCRSDVERYVVKGRGK